MTPPHELPFDDLVKPRGLRRGVCEAELCEGAARVVLSPSGGFLHASAAAHSLLGRVPGGPRVELYVFEAEACCWGRVTAADGRALEVHAVRGAWRSAPAWIGMLTRVRPAASSRLELEQVLAAAQEANARLERLASVDPLTSLLNRRGVEAALRRETACQDRNGEPLAVLLIDCDDFKRVNDERGHCAGDQVLVQIARRMQSSLRPSDWLARIGGDEFLVLLPNTGSEAASQVAARLRLAVAEIHLGGSEGVVEVSVSLGLALLTDRDVTLEGVLAHADPWLRRSKRHGKNRLSAAGADALD